ncbi:MAG: hypothetical protein HYV68_03240 [Candidatus Taylorbacteria bacterium]|nr:hypothetical protein [Candidatus Taylorbacteria bacterium]
MELEWSATLTTPSQKHIKSISVKHNNGYEAWSTASDNIYGKQPYPLVVVEDGAQLNTAYNQMIPQSGTRTLSLYGQIETETFSGGTLAVVFDDGASVSTQIPASSLRPISPYSTSSLGASVLDALRLINPALYR